jgi:hypothetical protein
MLLRERLGVRGREARRSIRCDQRLYLCPIYDACAVMASVHCLVTQHLFNAWYGVQGTQPCRATVVPAPPQDAEPLPLRTRTSRPRVFRTGLLRCSPQLYPATSTDNISQQI